MLKSDNFVLNKTTAINICLDLNTKFNKTLPGHTEVLMTTFNMTSDPNEPTRTCFVKQNNYLSLLEDSNEQIILVRQNYTLLGHMQSISFYQPAVNDYNKEIAPTGAKLWEETCLFFVPKDLALSKASISNTYSAYNTQQNNCIYQLQ